MPSLRCNHTILSNAQESGSAFSCPEQNLVATSIIPFILQQFSFLSRTTCLKPRQDGLSDLVGGILSSQIGSDNASSDDGIDSSVDLSSGVGVSKEFEHESSGTDGSDWVRDRRNNVGDIGSRSMHGFTLKLKGRQ